LDERSCSNKMLNSIMIEESKLYGEFTQNSLRIPYVQVYIT